MERLLYTHQEGEERDLGEGLDGKEQFSQTQEKEQQKKQKKKSI